MHALGLAGVSAMLLAAAAVLPLGVFECPLRAATGIACPTCGCTRAFHFFVRGDFGAALRASPLGAVLALACAVHLSWTILRLCGLPWAPRLRPLTPKLRAAAVFAIAVNWAYVALS
ncbi:MAG TPA: DUF2752 domain-containing protein [Myxococcales bacterium]